HAERVQHAARGNVEQPGRLGHGRGADGSVFVVLVQSVGIVGRLTRTRHGRQADPATDAAEHRDVLVSAGLPGNRIADDSGAETALPHHLAGVAVNRAEVTAQAAVEGETAIRHQRAAPVRIRVRDFPLRLAGQHVELLELAGYAGFLRVHVDVR